MFAESMTGPQVEGLITLVIAVAIVIALKARRRYTPSASAHGTARTATDRELRSAGMFDGKGLLLGRTLGKAESLLHLPRYVHLALFAPTGAGKGVSFLIPWLRTYTRGSVVALDPKGELCAATADARRAMGQRVVVLAPFDTNGDSFNPLDLIGTGPECIDECRALAEAMVVRAGDEKDPHWNSQAANVLTAVLAYVCANFTGPERSLSSLREILTAPGMLDGCGKALQGMGGIFARLAGVVLSLEDRERASVLSTVHRHLTFLDSPAVLPATASGWDAGELLTGNVAVYLVLPPNQLEAQSRWLRLVLASLLRLVGGHGMAKGREALFLLDEAAQLGHMPPVEQGLTLLRASGLRLVLAYQSLGQLSAAFKDRESVLLDNTDQIYFGAQDATARRLSERLGQCTEVAQSYSENSGRSYTAGGIDHHGGGGTNHSSGSSLSVSVHARALLTPDEIERLPPTVAVGFFRGLPPVVFRRVLYHSDPLFHPRRFRRLRRAVRWPTVGLLAGALFAVSVNLNCFKKGESPWQPHKRSPDRPDPSPTWPRR